MVIGRFVACGEDWSLPECDAVSLGYSYPNFRMECSDISYKD